MTKRAVVGYAFLTIFVLLLLAGAIYVSSRGMRSSSEFDLH
jgi:hypothetical protein